MKPSSAYSSNKEFMSNTQQHLVEKHTNRYIKTKLREFEQMCDAKYKVVYVRNSTTAGQERFTQPYRKDASATYVPSRVYYNQQQKQQRAHSERRMAWSGHMLWDDYFRYTFSQLPEFQLNCCSGVSINRSDRFRTSQKYEITPSPGQYESRRAASRGGMSTSINERDRFETVL